MQLRDALNDYKRHRGDRTRFPGERRTRSGRFSGYEGRLVHICEDGSIRDFSYPLVGLTGIARSRLGVCAGGVSGSLDGVRWFDTQRNSQRYHGDTALVVTDHETEYGTVTQYDLTLGDVHVTHLDVSDAERSLSVVVSVGFAPDGRNTRIGQLHHGDAIEVYHASETDYLASATGFETVRGCAFGGFAELLDERPVEYPRSGPENPYDEDLLSGDSVGMLPTRDGTATLATLLTTRGRSRADALDAVRTAVDSYDAETLERAAEAQVEPSVSAELPYAYAIATDLHVLSLLTGRSGLRIAGPEFDPYYAHSGGYGYSWFRDDAEIARFLLTADRQFDLGLEDWHARSARAYAETQLDDGTWPHRVWSSDAALAPGWANSRIEGTETGEAEGDNYQADQTASVAAYLGRYNASGVLERALDGLDATLASDGRPVTCQNAWEDMSGRFGHTVAVFLEAYAAAGTTTDDLAEHAIERANTVYDAVDDLWVEDRGIYALREYGESGRQGTLDTRCDSATLALAGAHRTYARIGTIDEDRLDRLVSHVERVIDELWHEDCVAGLVRYEGDTWRQREQDHEKIWTVSTAWGAHAAASLAAMLIDREDERADRMAETARELLALVLPSGPLCLDNGYLPEQVFNDGTPDSATPLGWPHALRTVTIALMDEYDLLEE